MDKKRIKELYGFHITNIDFLIIIKNDIFFIQSKFEKNRPDINNVKNFIIECDNIKSKLKKYFRYHLIFLTRVAYLNNFSGINLFLYDYPIEKEEYSYKEYEYLLMKLYKYIVQETDIRLGLKEYLSSDILMSYVI